MAEPSNADLINGLRAALPPEIAANAPPLISPITVNSLPSASSTNSVSGVPPEDAVKKEIKMADIVTGTVTGQLDTTSLMQDHADIRREGSEHASDIRRDVYGTSADIRRETAKEASDLNDSIKTAGWANSDRTGTEADRVVAQDTAYFIAGQQYAFSNATALAALKASTDQQFAATQAAIALAAQQTSAAATLAGSKAEAATALGQALIGQQIVADGNATRALVNGLKMDELNRMLSERNAEIVESRGDSRHWQGQYSNGQFAQLTSQVNALNSQLTETRQGMVNFGTMSGVGQSTTANSVR
jgi:hypothetical protein